MKPPPLLRSASAALAAVLLLAGPAAHAGRSCEARKLTPQAIERGLELAERTRQVLEAEHQLTGQQVVVLARAGQDLSKYGLRWSHLGFAYREVAQGQPVWRVVHKLNHCGTAEGALYRQGLGEFFLDDLWRQQAAWSPLSPALEAGLLPLLRDDRRLAALHHKPYSLVSYAWGSRYQQSNQWAIETLAMAQPQASPGRAQAQAWLAARDYQPTVLKLGPLTRLGGRMTAANIAFDDHPDHKRYSGRIETVTADSVFAWLSRAGLGAVPRTLQLD